MAFQNSYVDATSLGIHPPSYRLPDSSHVGIVTLAVSSLEKSVAFYRDVIGLAVLRQDGPDAELGVGGKVFLRLKQLEGVQPIGRRTRLGLYHTAFLLPSRAALGSFIQHLQRIGEYFGAGDHIYSEALYLVDPDGLSVEVYADRPREQWKTRGHELLSATEAVNLGSVVADSAGEWKGAPEGTKVGHVHLYIGDLETAARFYHEGLGYTVMTWTYPGVLFISAGGYHHHIGINVWAAGSQPASEQDARLLSWELVVPDAEEIAKLQKNMEQRGWETTTLENGSLKAVDPWGIPVHVVLG
ncbi:MAG: VOC family protein [Acidobacteriaceae bacterium]|nr:VOC family protein [Acidobacteriaceae bacterium]